VDGRAGAVPVAGVVALVVVLVVALAGVLPLGAAAVGGADLPGSQALTSRQARTQPANIPYTARTWRTSTVNLVRPGCALMKALHRAALPVLAVATCALVAFAETASAASEPTPAATKARAATAISVRLASLNAAISAVGTNRVITSTDRTTLLTTLNGDLSGLTALRQKITADTDATQARADYRTIFTGYRVYALALPQARYAAAVDDITDTVLPRLTDALKRLAALLAGSAADHNSADVQAAMTDLDKQILAITSTTTGLSASVLAFTPAQYNANHALLAGPRAQLRTARADVDAARKDIATVIGAVA
jgi:hypothetical protein